MDKNDKTTNLAQGRAGAPQTDTPATIPLADVARKDSERDQQASQQPQPMASEEQSTLAAAVQTIDLETTEVMADAADTTVSHQESNEAQKASENAPKKEPSKPYKPLGRPSAAELAEIRARWTELPPSEAGSRATGDMYMSGAIPAEMDLGDDSDIRHLTEEDQILTEWERQGKNPGYLLMYGEHFPRLCEIARDTAIMVEWKKAGKPKCTIRLSSEQQCGGFHPEALHITGKAEEAAKKRAAHSLLAENAPDRLREIKARDAKDRDRQNKTDRLRRQWLGTIGQDNALSLIRDKTETTGSKRKKRPDSDADGDSTVDNKKQKESKLPGGDSCKTCGKRHKGECRACPTCKNLHQNSKECPKKGAKTSGSGQNPVGQGRNQPPQVQQGSQAARPMSRDAVMQHLVQNIYTEAGFNMFINLMNADNGSAPTSSPQNGGNQQPRTSADAARKSNKRGR